MVWHAAEKLGLSRRHSLTVLKPFVDYDNLTMICAG
ncbi:hypothetical protein MNJPNG_09460 [Cupriavidus oxalaticus]